MLGAFVLQLSLLLALYFHFVLVQQLLLFVPVMEKVVGWAKPDPTK
jgi:hypothetical protein